MKKMIIATIALTFAGYTNAQTGADTIVAAADTVTTTSNATAQDKRTLVNVNDLPEAVKTALESEAYAGWKPSAAYWVENTATKNAYYEIELSKGTDKTIVKLDKSGQVIK